MRPYRHRRRADWRSPGPTSERRPARRPPAGGAPAGPRSGSHRSARRHRRPTWGIRERRTPDTRQHPSGQANLPTGQLEQIHGVPPPRPDDPPPGLGRRCVRVRKEKREQYGPAEHAGVVVGTMAGLALDSGRAVGDCGYGAPRNRSCATRFARFCRSGSCWCFRNVCQGARFSGPSLSVNVEFNESISVGHATDCCPARPGPSSPMCPTRCRRSVPASYVGRIRTDPDVPDGPGLVLCISNDNRAGVPRSTPCQSPRWPPRLVGAAAALMVCTGPSDRAESRHRLLSMRCPFGVRRMSCSGWTGWRRNGADGSVRTMFGRSPLTVELRGHPHWP